MTGLEAGPKTYFENASIEEKNHEMILALANKLASQSDALKFATAYEHKNNIKKKYFTIDELLQHPICLSYLMKFCKIQHNSENLSFLTDVDEYREIFNGDDNSCWKNWRDTDTRVSIDLDIDEKYLENQWISKACKKQALDKINDIFKKYFHSDSVSQASISNNVLDKTKKRIQLISLYGAGVFEEASIDPLITLERDVLPRFRNSTCCHDMIISLSFCEPPPPAASLEVLPPGNILLHISSLDSFSEHRRFSLEEVIGTQSLFYGFFKYLKDEKSVGINKLICIRNIDTFYQLMNINCYEEAFEIAWIIFRYFVVSGSVYQIDIPSTELKMIMLQLADPQKEIFDFVRVTALASLRADFEQFMKTSIYVDYPLMMREMKLALEPRDKCQSMTSLKWLRCDK